MSHEPQSVLKAVDFFCGAGGMSLGLRNAGIQVLAGIDNAGDCRKTYESNIIGAKFIKHDISTLSTTSLAERLDLQKNDPTLIFAGCSPCQFWSKIRTNKTKSARTAFLPKQFQKFIRHFQPGFVVVENVPGLRSRKEKTILPGFIEFLSNLGYSCDEGIINANHYGVPQNRLRYLLIASRSSAKNSLPPAKKSPSLTVRDFLGVRRMVAGTMARRGAAVPPRLLRRLCAGPGWERHRSRVPRQGQTQCAFGEGDVLT